MWREMFRFELRQQLRAPLLWTVALIFGLLAFAVATTDAVVVGGSSGGVYRNAPVVVINMLSAFSILAMFLVVIFVAGALLREFEQNSADMTFATPVSKGAWLGGRFGAGFMTAVVIMLVVAASFWIGSFMPWLEADRIGPTRLAAYAWGFGVIVIPNLLLVSALLYFLAALTRSMMATYMGVIAFFILDQIASSFLKELTTRNTAALLDPFGGHALSLATRYWSVAERNSALPELTGLLLANRLIWAAAAVGLLVLSYMVFRPDHEGFKLKIWRRRKRKADSEPALQSSAEIPSVTIRHDRRAHWQQFVYGTRRAAWSIVRGVPFLVMLLLGLANLTATLSASEMIYGTTVYPVTSTMLEAMQFSFQFLLWIILIFYSGELIWRDRSLETSELRDALPAPSSVLLASQLAALMLVILVFLALGALWCMGWQLIHGYTHLEPLLYVRGLALDAIPLVLVAVLAVFMQILANNKFMGYLLTIAVLATSILFAMMHLESNLYIFAGAPDVPYSDMNGFGHFWQGALWFYAYWGFFALGLIVLTALLWVRGTALTWKIRLRLAAARFGPPARITLAVALAGFVGTGIWNYYNTMVLNAYLPTSKSEARQADYEKNYAHYADLAQPRIVRASAEVDIHPYDRRLALKGHYRLVNRHDEPIDTLYMEFDAFMPKSHKAIRQWRMPAHEIEHDNPEMGIRVFRLNEPLAPGQDMDLEFELDWQPRGFTNRGSPDGLVANGTFVNNAMLFPQLSYNRGAQLIDRSKRRKHGLDPDLPRMPPLSDDEQARANTYISHDADWIDFEATVCTAADQIAMAPGKRVSEWSRDDGQRCFHYQMDQPMLNFFSFMSARYAVERDRHAGVDIEVYHHPRHDYNVKRMIAAVKKSLDYFNREFTPYQFDQVRILEFPGYASFAQAFANTIPFSESIGFIADLRDPDDLDYVTDITAHEMAHQWWAHRVIGADMQGSTLLSEALAQYSALMILRESEGENAVRKFLRYELDQYLHGRAGETGRERPLARVENQGYIHYRKGSMVMYALQDYIGERTFNSMLKQFLVDYGFQQPPYVNTNNFLTALELAAGPEWQAVIDDWFRHITLYDNRVLDAVVTESEQGGWDVRMRVQVGKTVADGDGAETAAPMDVPVDIGIFARGSNGGDEKVVYLARHDVEDGENIIELHVDEKPHEVGIDPYNKLIDRVAGDNRMKVVFE